MTRLDQIAEQISKKPNPPIHLWQSSPVGIIDIHIDSMGNWFHEGGVIKRQELVKLFASILWFENGQHYLVTPAEKLAISVVDVPFVVQQMERVEGAWVATTNTSDVVVISDSHPVQLRQYQGQEVPYLRIRYDLWARVSRSIYFEWVTEALDAMELGEELEGGEISETDKVVLKSGSYEIQLSAD